MGVLLKGTVDWETNGEGLGRGLGKARWDVSWSAWAALTKHQRPGGLKHRHLYLAVLEAGKYRIGVPADLVSSWLTDGCLLSVSSR